MWGEESRGWSVISVAYSSRVQQLLSRMRAMEPTRPPPRTTRDNIQSFRLASTNLRSVLPVSSLVGIPRFLFAAVFPALLRECRGWGNFAQDSWRLRSNLTLNYGVRWDYVARWAEMHHQTPLTSHYCLASFIDPLAAVELGTIVGVERLMGKGKRWIYFRSSSA